MFADGIATDMQSLGFILIVSFVLAMLAIAVYARRRPVTLHPETHPVAPPVDTTFVMMDTEPHNVLRSLVDTTNLSEDDLDDPISFERELDSDDAKFVVDQVCRRASETSPYKFVRGNIISKDTVPMGPAGNLVRVAVVVHVTAPARTQTVRFAVIVQWDGSYTSPPIVRSVSFDDLEPNQRHLAFAPADFSSVVDEYSV